MKSMIELKGRLNWNLWHNGKFAETVARPSHGNDRPCLMMAGQKTWKIQKEENLMSTANFRTMEYDLPMVVGGIYDDDFVEQLKADYLAEIGEEITEKLLEVELRYFAEEDFTEAAELAENLNENLEYYKIEVIGGHYVGFQFYVRGRIFDDYEEMDNDDAHYYFDMCRSRALRAERAEMRKIEKWLRKIASEYKYDMIECIGRFGNGEAKYRKINIA